jgi:hypothetical protein
MAEFNRPKEKEAVDRLADLVPGEIKRTEGIEPRIPHEQVADLVIGR